MFSAQEEAPIDLPRPKTVSRRESTHRHTHIGARAHAVSILHLAATFNSFNESCSRNRDGEIRLGNLRTEASDACNRAAESNGNGI